jgi:hypothetical protein
VINTKTHAVLDYIVGILLIAAPWLFNFADKNAATIIPVIIGSVTILYSLLTDYEFSLLSLIPFRLHLGLDIASALLLIISPWLFAFSDRISWPHVTVGILEIVVVLMSRRRTGK